MPSDDGFYTTRRSSLPLNVQRTLRQGHNRDTWRRDPKGRQEMAHAIQHGALCRTSSSSRSSPWKPWASSIAVSRRSSKPLKPKPTPQMTHTDLKPENILLAQSGPPRRSDFPREAQWQAAWAGGPPCGPLARPGEEQGLEER